MKPSVLPVRIDQMPREARMPSAEPIYTPKFLIALALTALPFNWSGRLLSEESAPVLAVLDALKRGGWKIVPMERSDFDERH